MIKYSFRDVCPVVSGKKADAQKVGEALAKLTTDGQLTPGTVVSAAKAPRHPLHPYFEWDDTKAAKAFRLDQARALIRSIRVEDEDTEEGHAPAFISIADKGGFRYHTTESVKNSEKLQAIILVQAERDLAAFERRYKELLDICALIREAREKVRERITESRSAA